MEIADFIKQLETEFDEVAPGVLQPNTSFRDLDEWSSMHALIIIALIDTEYDITLSGDDLRASETVQDLFDLVVSRKTA